MRKQKIVQKLRGRQPCAFANGNVFGHILNHFNHALVLVERHFFLLVVADFDGCPDFDSAAVVGLVARDDVQQCGLASAVRAHHADFLAAAELIGEIVEQHLVAKTLVDAEKVDDFCAQPRTFYVDLHRFAFGAFEGRGLDVFKRVDAVFGLCSARLRHPSNPVKFLFVELAGFLYLAVLVVDTLFALGQEIRVVAAVFEYLLVVDFVDDVAHAVQKIAVVRHHYQCRF